MQSPHGVHPHANLKHVHVSSTGSPQCSANGGDECRVWMPRGAFGKASRREKQLAAKMFGEQRGEEGWHYVEGSDDASGSWITVRRRRPEYATKSVSAQ